MTLKLIDNHASRLLRMSPEAVVLALGEELTFGAQTIVEDAKASILDGAVSGSAHKPSLPGEAPNADTHVLDASLHVGDLVETPGVIQTAAIADAPYAVHLELGTSIMVERPFLGPATRRAHPDVINALAKRFGETAGV